METSGSSSETARPMKLNVNSKCENTRGHQCQPATYENEKTKPTAKGYIAANQSIHYVRHWVPQERVGARDDEIEKEGMYQPEIYQMSH
jgi:hypothetical protein